MEPPAKHFRKREAILNCLRQTTVHPSAEWVYTRLKPELPDLSMGTVYRNLALFKDQGLIISLGTVNGVERFDGNIHPHVHYICTQCGDVLDLGGVPVPQELCRTAARSSGGSISGCQLTFTGVCRSCTHINKEETT